MKGLVVLLAGKVPEKKFNFHMKDYDKLLSHIPEGKKGSPLARFCIKVIEIGNKTLVKHDMICYVRVTLVQFMFFKVPVPF